MEYYNNNEVKNEHVVVKQDKYKKSNIFGWSPSGSG